ncbi:hypothetical protein EI94DRAFT_243659 [Lactarius quietus]|nr:hypothetical protein EI94DRAFT_243659 [Lactarius quietus]
MYRAPAFRRLWWFALGWSFAEVAVGVVQGYETLALYRDVLVPEGRARELAAAALTVAVRAPKNGATSASPPRARDERLWESMSRAEDGVTISEAIGSPVRPFPTAANGVDIQGEVDKDFDELVAVKTREELEELYGFPAIRVPVFVSSLLGLRQYCFPSALSCCCQQGTSLCRVWTKTLRLHLYTHRRVKLCFCRGLECTSLLTWASWLGWARYSQGLVCGMHCRSRFGGICRSCPYIYLLLCCFHFTGFVLYAIGGI